MKKFYKKSRLPLIMVLFALYFMFCNTLSTQAQRQITGKVINSDNGAPVEGITVKVKGINKIAITDSKGNYTLTIPDTIKSIEFSELQDQKIKKVEMVDANTINLFLTGADVDLFDMTLEELMDMEVTTASKKAEKISDAPAIVTTMSAQQIKSLGVQTLPQLMRYIPGFTVEDTYWRGPIVTSRGVAMTLYNDKILMLIDGVPAYEAVTLEYYLDVVPITAIKRIEIIRGPGSTLYGTNAFSGVINVITKNGDAKNKLQAYVKGGSFNTKGAGFSFGDKKCDVSYSISSTYTDNDGYNHTLEQDEKGVKNINLNYENDIQNFLAKIQYKNLKLTTGYYFQEIAKFSMTTAIAFGSNQVPNEGMAHHRKYYANLSYDFFKKNEKFNGNYTLHYDYMDKETGVGEFGSINLANALIGDTAYPLDLSTIDPSFAAPNYSLYKGQLFNSELQLSYNINKEHALIGGITHELRDCDNVYTMLGERGGKEIPTHEGSIPYPPDNVTDFGAYLQADGKLFNKLGYVAGIRMTYLGIPEEIYITPRAGVVYGITDNLNAKILYGQAFRGPGFQEQNFNVEGVAYGAYAAQRSLNPEKINTYEAALDYKLSKNYSLRVNGFYLNTIDQILRRPIAGSVDTIILGHDVGRIYDNFGEKEYYGGEVEFNGYPSRDLSFFMNASYRDGKDKESDEDLLYFIHTTANAGISATIFDKLTISPNVQYVGENEGSLGTGTNPPYQDNMKVVIDDFTILNLVVNYAITSQLNLTLTGRNLTDEKYYYPERIRRFIPKLPGGPGTSFYVQLGYNF